MRFLAVDKLRPGMILGRDLYVFDKETSRLAMLKAGQPITRGYIARLKKLEIVGVYVRDRLRDRAFSSGPIGERLQEEAVCNLQQMYSAFIQDDEVAAREGVRRTMDISKQLVTAILQEKDTQTSIASLKLYDDYTYYHSLGVAVVAIAIGVMLKLQREDLYELGLCGLLHDIGKMAVPIEIIAKPARLTLQEFEIIKRHPQYGTDFFSQYHLVSDRVFDGVLTHHEKYDGSGYPQGLSAHEIPVFGRICAVADVYDALTSRRPYREPNTPAEAMRYLREGAGSLFDPEIVQAFLRASSANLAGPSASAV